MLFHFIRHGDPIYNPDSITELGERQAEALANYLSELKIDKIYSSTSARAHMTAIPTSKKLNLECEMLDWAVEDNSAKYFAVDIGDNKKEWCFWDEKTVKNLLSPQALSLGKEWYKADFINFNQFEEGIKFFNEKADNFFKELGLIHDREREVYYVKEPKYENVAFFSHGGFAMAFLSSLLDIPYNIFCTKFMVLSTTSVVTIYFPTNKEVCRPLIMTYCDDSHLYKEGVKPYHY